MALPVYLLFVYTLIIIKNNCAIENNFQERWFIWYVTIVVHWCSQKNLGEANLIVLLEYTDSTKGCNVTLGFCNPSKHYCIYAWSNCLHCMCKMSLKRLMWQWHINVYICICIHKSQEIIVYCCWADSTVDICRTKKGFQQNYSY